MANTYKRLGAAAGSGTIGTAANLYTASGTAGTATICSSINICNTSSTTQQYSIAVNTASATFTAGEYIAYQAQIPANETFNLSIGVCLDPSARYLNVSSSSTGVVFSAFGVEMTP